MAKKKTNMILIIGGIILAFFIFQQGEVFQGIVSGFTSVTRSVDRSPVYTGDVLTVTLDITASTGDKAIAIQDTAPFTITGLSDNIYQTILIDTIQVQDTTKQYQLIASTSGTHIFTGIYNPNNLGDVIISGTSSIEVVSCTPTAETCNNIDDNCDYAIDESLTQSTTCGVGACSGNAGSETCSTGSWIGDTCNPTAGAVSETCNNIDDDCDGSTDESLSQQCGATDVGACEFGIQTCSTGSWGSCAGEVTSTTEICEDGIDQDCNGIDLISSCVSTGIVDIGCNNVVDWTEINNAISLWLDDTIGWIQINNAIGDWINGC